ncbi:hypothetical protein [Klebsiella aerogenes]|uniref:hypothetical protein n=1 Tax=Klebsiella aerogenes TaxID=548 RepID=UPI00292E536F|nr:hypothetical protein [Klebsiella aerogenes]
MMRDEVKLILPTSWKPCRDAFFSKLGVSKGGLGEQLFGNVYDALFTTSVDVKDEFNRFYSVEYADLAQYVEIRYGEVLDDNEADAERVFLVTWLPQIIDDVYEDNMLNTVFECIKKLEEEQNES